MYIVYGTGYTVYGIKYSRLPKVWNMGLGYFILVVLHSLLLGLEDGDFPTLWLLLHPSLGTAVGPVQDSQQSCRLGTTPWCPGRAAVLGGSWDLVN